MGLINSSYFHAIELKNIELKDVLIDLGCVLYTYMSEKKVVQSCINSFVVISELPCIYFSILLN